MGLSGIDCKRLLHIDMGALLEAVFRKIEMALRGSSDVDNIRSSRGEKVRHVVKVLLNRKSVVQLPGHQGLTVTHPNDLTTVDFLNPKSVGIGNLAASHDGCLKHEVRLGRSFGNSASGPPRWTPLASSQAWPSTSRCCSGCPSSTHANGAD